MECKDILVYIVDYSFQEPHLILWGIFQSALFQSPSQATGHETLEESSVNITVSSYDTTHLQENPQRLG